MSNSKSLQLWIVNVVNFFLLTLLAFTGLINWLLLPRGYEAKGGALVSLRHFLREVHEWTALVFIVSVTLHLAFHWSYIKTNLKQLGIIKG